MRGSTASRRLPATCSASPTICAARSMRCRRRRGRSAKAGMKALIDGVELTERELLKALEKNGVRQFTPHGEKFDPNVHQAMYEVPDRVGAGRQRRPGDAARLHDRRARAAAGAGRGGEGRPEGRADFSVRQRQPGPRSRIPDTAPAAKAAKITTRYLQLECRRARRAAASARWSRHRPWPCRSSA